MLSKALCCNYIIQTIIIIVHFINRWSWGLRQSLLRKFRQLIPNPKLCKVMSCLHGALAIRIANITVLVQHPPPQRCVHHSPTS